MMAAVIAVGVITLTGAAVARALDRAAPIGLWYLYGCGVMMLALLFLPWSRWTVLAVAGAAVATLMATAARRGTVETSVSSFRPTPVDLLTMLLLAIFVLFATLTAPWEWDAWAIWLLKARLFIEQGGPDWTFLEGKENAWAHPDYPLLVPINLAVPALISGTWDDRWLGLMTAAILISGVLAVRSATARMYSPAVSATMALTLAAVGASRYVGTAETPMIVLAVAALAYLHAGEWRHAAILFGLAASTKNEGMALLVAVTIALIVTRRLRELVRLWPAYVVPAPWLILRAVHDLPTDVTSGPMLSRILDRLDETFTIIRLIGSQTGQAALWLVIIVASLVAARRVPLLFTVVVIQILLCVAVYYATPHDVAWHVTTSWDRISRQLAAMAAFAALAGLAGSFSSELRWETDGEITAP